MILFLQFAVRVSLHAKCALTSGSEMPTPVWNAEETTQGKTPTESQELMVHCLLLVILSKIKYSGKEKLYTCYKCHTLRSSIIWHYYSSSLLVTGVCYTLRVNILLNIQYKKKLLLFKWLLFSYWLKSEKHYRQHFFCFNQSNYIHYIQCKLYTKYHCLSVKFNFWSEMQHWIALY